MNIDLSKCLNCGRYFTRREAKKIANMLNLKLKTNYKYICPFCGEDKNIIHYVEPVWVWIKF